MAGINDDGVMATNDDAHICKRSCVTLNYWEDPYLECFSKGHFERKPPEINRGYYARISAVNYLLQQFLSVVKKRATGCQIVNLGCGFDTLFWRLKTIYKETCIKSFVDVDLGGITTRKVYAIRHKPKLLSVLGDDIKCSSSELHATDYHLISCDLRSIVPHASSQSASATSHHNTTCTLQEKLFTDCGLDKNLPTVFISECVLVYIESSYSNALLSWITSVFSDCFFINYEQVNLNDRFGEIMLENLRLRHCDLLGLDNCKNLKSQEDRFKSNGWDQSVAWDMNTIYKTFLPKAEIERIERIEFLDERDLLEQLLTHYCIVIGCKGFKDFLTDGDILGFESNI